ncbi:hypothetical protein ACI2SW_10525 [Ralstonia nicotianae]|nr:hypothetical protein [Ralstonia pseudosolanacearum]
MARPSDLESQPVFFLKTGVVFAFGVALVFAFRQLSTETARFY